MNPPATPTRRSLSRRLLRWTGRAVLALVALVAVVVLVAYGVSTRRMAQHFDVPPTMLLNTAFVPDSALVVAGERLATIRACNDCHGTDLGGKVMIDDPMLGRVVTANLTPGGAADTFSMADWDRAVRHGVSPAGRGYLVMPSHEFNRLSDADLEAIVAYLRHLPPAHHDLPRMQVRPLGHVLNATGVIDLVPASLIDHAAPRSAPPPAAPTPEYGAYLATTCMGCHGKDFSGGKIPGVGIMASNLTPDAETGLGTWSEADFARLLKTGTPPDGRTLDPFMPITMTKQLSEIEVAALWAYLRTLPPVAKKDT